METPHTQVTFWGHYDTLATQLLTQYGLATLALPVPPMDASGIARTREVCTSFDVLMLDSYDTQQSYIDGLKHSTCRLALIDDDQRRDLSGADMVICFRVGSENLDYGARHQLLGPTYLPVKPELYALRNHNLALEENRPIEQILVFLSGGSIGTKHLQSVLQALDFPGMQVSYLAPSELPFMASSRAKYIPFTPAIESVYAQSDFVISGGGLTKYECAYAGITNACLSLTDLQDQDTREMAAQGFTLDLGPADSAELSRLRRQIHEFISDPRALSAQRRAFASKLDAEGPRRVAQALSIL
ncbi:hypothetical protein [Ottowia thiooxydans]|uniref:hypothetical protein n=1 Tax=Ottowia thiooxydans TaxID=219182 RepID=UPI0012EC6322|nr:hypothetical protein [Ottowia thiooxydans]